MLLGIACGAWGIYPMALCAIDVSQAFMNGPLENHRVALFFRRKGQRPAIGSPPKFSV